MHLMHLRCCFYINDERIMVVAERPHHRPVSAATTKTQRQPVMNQAVSPLPSVSAEVHRRFRGHPDQVAEARQYVSDLLEGGAATNDAILCVSELAANAVAHSRSGRPGGWFTVRAAISDSGRLRIGISDEGGPWAPVLLTDGQHGRGLAIVRKLAQAWGVSTDSDDGRTVWFEVDRGPADLETPT
jgi:serine/threonine-protein kinase RsbW